MASFDSNRKKLLSTTRKIRWQEIVAKEKNFYTRERWTYEGHNGVAVMTPTRIISFSNPQQYRRNTRLFRTFLVRQPGHKTSLLFINTANFVVIEGADLNTEIRRKANRGLAKVFYNRQRTPVKVTSGEQKQNNPPIKRDGTLAI